MVHSKTTFAVTFLALTFLVGCGNNEPSNSDLENQITKQLPSCPQLSITNFQKINGYPQTDGSYIDQVQFDVVYVPTDAISDAINEYYPQLIELNKEEENDSYQANAIFNGWVQVPADQRNQRMQALDQKTDSARTKLNNLQTKMTSQLSVAIGPNCSASDLIGVFSNTGNVSLLTKIQRTTVNETLHLIKSDNGWVTE